MARETCGEPRVPSEGKTHANAAGRLHDPVTAAITGAAIRAYRGAVSALDAPGQELQQGPGQHCGPEVWSGIHKKTTRRMASPEGGTSGAWGWGPEAAGPPGRLR